MEKWEDADIHWPAIGVQDAETAKRYAEALLEAAETAEQWTKERVKP